MSIKYWPSRSVGELRQGEIIAGIHELRTQHPPVAVAEGTNLVSLPIMHHRTMVMTAECDLLNDYQDRQNYDVMSDADDQISPSRLQHILLCDVYEAQLVLDRAPGGDVRRRIRQNQDERYQYLPGGQVGDSGLQDLPDLILDFKKVLALPTLWLYKAIHETHPSMKVGILPPIYLQHTMQRFFSFCSRIGIPD